MTNFVPGPDYGVRRPARTAPTFTARVHELGINFAVDVPPQVTQWFGERSHIAVAGLLEELGIRATLTPRGEGRHRLYLNKATRDAAGLGAGDEVSIVLWPDPTPRDPTVPDDVEQALEKAGVLDKFLAWPPSHRRECLVAIEDAKREETRRRRIERTIESLRERR